MTKKVSKILLFSTLAVISVLILLATYTQTGAFRSNIRSALYELVRNNLNASVYFGEIRGNLVTGFTIDTVMIYVDNAPFIESGNIAVKYNIFDLLKKEIHIDTLTIENPSVHLTRWKDSTWNVDRMVPSTSPHDTTPSPWKISAKQIFLTNASFQLLDSTGEFASSASIDGRRCINYSNIFVTDIFLSAGVSYTSDQLKADITQLSLTAPKEQFSLSSLSANLYYSKDTVRASNLVIRSPHTSLRTSAELAGVDVFSKHALTEFETKSVRAKIDESEISTSDLQIFLPELYFLKGKIKLDASFQGTFGQLNVLSLNASFGKTSLSLSGTVSNIHQPKELRLNIVSKQSSIHPPDVPQLMPYFGIPQYSQLGQLTLDFQFVGKPLDFVVISKLQSEAGTVTVDGEMIITEENLHYKGLLAGNNVNLEKIFENKDFASQINTKAYIAGDGTTIDRLKAEARIEIDSSTIRGIPVSSAALEMKANEKIIDADLSLNSPHVQAQATTVLDFRTDEPAYMLSTRVRNLNLAPFVHDHYYTSRLSFDLNRTAKSLNILDGISNTNVQILPSTFQEYTIDSSSVDVKVERDSSYTRRISVQSPLADGELYGTFTFSGFLTTLQRSINHITQLYTYQRRIVDSSYNENPHTTVTEDAHDTIYNNIGYSITVKNLQPIAVFFRLPTMDAQATLHGSLTGNGAAADFNGTLQMRQGMIAQDSTILYIRGVQLQYSLSDIEDKTLSTPLPLNVALNLEGNEISINQTSFHFPKFYFTHNSRQGECKFYSDIDTTMSVALEGIIFALQEEERLDFSTVRLIYQGYDLQNSNPIRARLSKKGISLDSALFVHKDQTLLLDGTYSFYGGVEAIAEINNFHLQDLYFFSSSHGFREQALSFGGIVSAKAKATGTLENPGFWVEMNGEHISFKQSVFGHIIGSARYADKSAVLQFEIHTIKDSVETKDLVLSGRIPLDLRLINVENRTDLDGVDLMLKASNLQMAALDPFIPELTIHDGIVKCDIHISGSLQHPLLNGQAQMDSSTWVLDMTGISYLASGKLLLADNKVLFTDFTVSNRLNDYPDGAMGIGGYISLHGFQPEEYHVRASGELMVLHERSRMQGSAFFGTLVASTGNDSLRFDGNFNHSRIKGVVYVQQASLIFPPTQQALSYSSSLFNTVEFIDDTSKVVKDTTAAQSLSRIVQQMFSKTKSEERTFLDGFEYDLTIQTRGTVRVNMIFNANAGAYEELYAELDGKLALSKNENGVQLKGTINVGNESKYTFYKTFNANGSLIFNGDPQNPRLNIAATYEGSRCINSSPLKDDCLREEKVIVTLNISGTRLSPQVKIGLKTVDQNGKETLRSGDVENDAIAFLLTSSPGTPGKFRDELTAQDRNRIGDQLYSTLGGTFLNTMLSGYVMDFVTRNNIPYVKRVEVSDVGADPNINVRLELFDAVISAGGRVFSNINNTNISIQRPILGKENRNFMLEVEKKTESFTYSLESRTILSARIFYRFTF
jgi:hypothetical protein